MLGPFCGLHRVAWVRGVRETRSVPAVRQRSYMQVRIWARLPDSRFQTLDQYVQLLAAQVLHDLARV